MDGLINHSQIGGCEGQAGRTAWATIGLDRGQQKGWMTNERQKRRSEKGRAMGHLYRLSPC